MLEIHGGALLTEEKLIKGIKKDDKTKVEFASHR